MGVRIISDTDCAALYCSTSGFAFGPVFDQGDNFDDPQERAERFLKWLDQFGSKFARHPYASDFDARCFTEAGLQSAYTEWHESNHHLGGNPCEHKSKDMVEEFEPQEGEVYGDFFARCPDCGAPLKADAWIEGGDDDGNPFWVHGDWEIDTDRDYAQPQEVKAA